MIINGTKLIYSWIGIKMLYNRLHYLSTAYIKPTVLSIMEIIVTLTRMGITNLHLMELIH